MSISVLIPFSFQVVNILLLFPGLNSGCPQIIRNLEARKGILTSLCDSFHAIMVSLMMIEFLRCGGKAFLLECSKVTKGHGEARWLSSIGLE